MKKSFLLKGLTTTLLSSTLLMSSWAWGAIEYGIVGDAGRTTDNAALVRQSLVKEGVFELIMPGDNLYSSTYDKVWAPWIKSGFKFNTVAIGNHNLGYANEVRFFKMPGEYYTKVQDKMRLIVLNSDNSKTVKEQMAFLEKTLKDSTEDLIFLMYHHPSYTVSTDHTWDEKKEFQNSIRPLLKKYRNKLTAILVGHDHLASLIQFGDLPVVLSGAVQNIRIDKPINYNENGINIKTLWYFDHTPHWVKMTLASSNSVQVDFIKAQNNKVGCTALLITGKPAQLQSNCK